MQKVESIQLIVIKVEMVVVGCLVVELVCLVDMGEPLQLWTGSCEMDRRAFISFFQLVHLCDITTLPLGNDHIKVLRNWLRQMMGLNLVSLERNRRERDRWWAGGAVVGDLSLEAAAIVCVGHLVEH